MRIGVNCGHTLSGTVGSGAVGYLGESDETRAVGYALIRQLRNRGNEVVDCTDDTAESVSENLREICRLANAQPLDMFISIHFNSGGGRGCEAYTYGARDVADAGEILTELEGLGFLSRGLKDGSNLYVIRNTTAPAVLIEVCFVDTLSDAQIYTEQGAERVAEAICDAISKREDEITMSQYEELKGMIENLSGRVNDIAEDVRALKNPTIYNYIDYNMPEWARPTIEKLTARGYLRGGEEGLGLTDDMLRLLVINDRAGLYD